MSFSFRPLLFAACMALALPAQARDFRAAETQVSDYPTVEGIRYMGKLLNERSSGRLNIKVFANGTLGSERDTIEQLKIGGVDMIRLSVAPLNNIVPETIVLSLPFIFRSEDHMHTVLDGPIGDEILAAMEKQGIVGLAWYDDGARSIYTKGRPVRTLADLKGMKIRVQQSDMWVAMMRAFGANATPLPYGEVYSALQTGVVDGAENNFPSYLTARHFEVAKHYAMTEHSLTPEILAMSKRSFDRLPRADQEIVRQAARESVPVMREAWVKMEQDARRQVEAGGTQVVAADKEAFAKLVQPVYDQFVRDAKLRGLVERIRAA
jgi:tripartite ATP-independent transporter DctP family solute receptor